MSSNSLNKEHLIKLNPLEGVNGNLNLTKEKEPQKIYLRTYNSKEARKNFNNSIIKRILEGICFGYLSKKNK